MRIKNFYSLVLKLKITLCLIKKVKAFFGDIVACLDNGETILIEAYTQFGREEYAKSFNYLSRVYSNQVESGKNKYKDCKKVTCLNLMTGNYRRVNNEIVNDYNMSHKITHKIIDNGEIEYVLIRLDQIVNVRYTLNESRFIRWLKLINASSLEGMEKIGKGDEVMEQAIEFIKRYSGSEMDHNFDDIIAYHANYAEERGEKRGRLIQAKQTAKKLKAKSMNTKEISEITGLTIKEIEEI